VLEGGGGFFRVCADGIAHTFTVDVEADPVLVFASPAGFERFATELGQPATTDKPPAGLAVPGPDVLGPLAGKYGIEIVGPPYRVTHTATSDVSC